MPRTCIVKSAVLSIGGATPDVGNAKFWRYLLLEQMGSCRCASTCHSSLTRTCMGRPTYTASNRAATPRPPTAPWVTAPKVCLGRMAERTSRVNRRTTLTALVAPSG